MAAKYNDHSYVCPIVSQGVKTGERVIVDLLGGQRASFRTYEDLGMRKKLAEQWAEQMGRDKGLLIIAGLPEGGITTMTDVSLHGNRPAAARLRVHRGGEAPRAGDREHRRHDLQRRQRAKRRPRSCPP